MFRTEGLRQQDIEKGGGASQTSVFSSKFHALSNDSYNNSGKLLVPEIYSANLAPGGIRYVRSNPMTKFSTVKKL